MAAAVYRGTALALACAACTAVNVDARTFENTRWHVSAINGRATPARESYSMLFHHNHALGARFGCNSIGGTYRASGETLTVTGATMTLMGCPEPAASFESQGLSVLRLPMHIDWRSGASLRLANSAGSIELERLP
jgi:heat shock protein HslJ